MSKERMQKQKIDTLRKILDKSWEIVIAEGPDALSIRKIANAMNFAPNNLYNYFKNKEELLLYLKKDGYQWTMNQLREAMEQGTFNDTDGVCTLFRNIAKKLLHSALENPQKYIVMTSEPFMDQKEPMDQELTRLAADKIESGIATGELRKNDAVMTAINFRIIIIGFIRMVASEKEISKEKAEEMLDNLMDIIFDGIRKEKES